MQKRDEKDHTLTIWESTKDEAGLVATGCVLGCAVGVGGGWVVSQAVGTPLVPSLVVGGAAGTLVGGGVAAYAAHRIHESRADAACYADEAIGQALARGKVLNNADRRNAQVQDAIKAGVGEALKDVKFPAMPKPSEFGDAVGEALKDTLEGLLPDQRISPTA